MISNAPQLELELEAGLLEREAIDSVLDGLAPLFASTNGERSGLFVASTNAGTATTLRFWSDSQAVGVALANPELFPWCLANAPCAALARRFHITGPNFTWLGGDEAMQAAWSTAHLSLQQSEIEIAYVVGICFGTETSPGQVQAWCLRQEAATSKSGCSR